MGPGCRAALTLPRVSQMSGLDPLRSDSDAHPMAAGPASRAPPEPQWVRSPPQPSGALPPLRSSHPAARNPFTTPCGRAQAQPSDGAALGGLRPPPGASAAPSLQRPKPSRRAAQRARSRALRPLPTLHLPLSHSDAAPPPPLPSAARARERTLQTVRLPAASPHSASLGEGTRPRRLSPHPSMCGRPAPSARAPPPGLAMRAACAARCPLAPQRCKTAANRASSLRASLAPEPGWLLRWRGASSEPRSKPRVCAAG